MQLAFILINTKTGSAPKVLRNLKKIEEVEDPHIVYGVYDIIVKVKADSIDQLRDIISSRIRRIQDVRSTLTMAVVQPGQTQYPQMLYRVPASVGNKR